MDNYEGRRPSIVRNLALALAATVSVVSVVVIIFIAVLSLASEKNAIQIDSDDAANHLSKILEMPLWNTDDGSIMVIASTFFRDKSVAGIEITGVNGRQYYNESRVIKKEDTARVREIRHNGKKIGWVKIVYSWGSYSEKIVYLVGSLAALGLVLVFSLFAAVNLLIRFLVKLPIDSFSEAVAAYQDEHTVAFQKAPFVEFERLSSVLESMSAKINNQLADLKSLNAGLRDSSHEKDILIKELNASENKFRVAFLMSPDAIMITRLSDGKFTEINEGFTRMSGYSREEVEGKTANELGLWADPADRDAVVADMKMTGAVNNKEANYRTKDGRIITGLFSSVFLDIGAEKCFLSIIRDITDRIKIEKVLAENEHKFRLAFDTSPDAININRVSDGVYLDINAGFTAITGYTKEEALNKTGLELRIWANPEDREKLVKNLMEKAYVSNLEAVFRKKDGSMLTGLMSAGIMTINGEKYMLAVTRDITERKQSEETLRLRESYLNAIIENQPGLLWLKDREGRFLAVNRNFAIACGHENVESVHGKKDTDIWPKELADAYISDDARVMKNAQPVVVEEPIMNKGVKSWFETFKAPIVDGQGKVIGTTGYSRDITERKQAQEKLERTVEELERSNDELEKFAYAASHDLQEPLRMVSNYVQLLKIKYRGKIDADADFYIDTAVKGAVSMSELVKGLLDLSRIGRIERPVEEVNMNEVAQEVKNMFAAKIVETGADIVIDDLPVIKGERIQMGQLLQNLLSNAVKFSSREKTPRVKVSCEAIPEYWRFCVRDNGIGISPRYFDKIFVVFQKLHGKDEYEGSGIGLAICKKIVEHHKGKIWVESEEGQGAGFYFTIPRK